MNAWHFEQLARAHRHPRPEVFGRAVAGIVERGVVGRAALVDAMTRVLLRTLRA